jgi:hypothetical protein
MFELKNLVLEPGARVTDRFVRDVAGAVQRLANWHGCPLVQVQACEPAAFGAALQAEFDAQGIEQ